MYYLLYWAIVLTLLGWKWYTGTLTDRREAQRDDFKSFVQHAGEQLDEDAGLKKGSASASASGSCTSEDADLEAGEGKAPALPRDASPRLQPPAEGGEQAQAHHISQDGDSVDSFERREREAAAATAAAAPPPATAV